MYDFKKVPNERSTLNGRYKFHCDDVEIGSVILMSNNIVEWSGGRTGAFGKTVGQLCEIWSFEIYEEYRGLGHSRAFLQRIYLQAKYENCQRIWLRCNKSNTPALRLYESEGFGTVNERREDYEMERPC